MAEAPDSIWMYTPSFPLAVLAAVLYGLVFAWIFYLTVIRYRAWYFLCVVIGAAIEVAGYALRCYSIKNPREIGPFASTLSLIVLAPVLVAAGNYLLIGRLIRAVLSSSTGHRVFGVHGRKITRIFVIFDIISFLVQASGSSVASSVEWVGTTADVGVNILIGGLALQAVAFSFFLAIFGRFHYLAKKGYLAQDAPAGWEGVVIAVYVSSLLILIRCIYRVAEFAEGVDGYSFRHEWLFWVFESLPMLIAIGIFCFFHPSACLGRDGGKSKILGKAGESIDSEEAATELRPSHGSSRIRRH
ncbi:RTA1 like protein-domain-containing protein [Cercophora newfieldiana]|uniref:RTA1 like protein-domain-containing protein n=1 Tax=Cercophora newfieldiana TaxID=92897 RepID=A0AA39XVJ8_9PEZI|nr:RTA1 like protein-domain-containing protein [Cercophora newfieldiana]